jgi:NitT/TauT family transport system substrate-binding protein
MKSRSAALVLAVLAGTGLLAACGDSGGSSDKDTTVRLGFFPNITHATALVGVQKGFYAKYLGKAPKALTFNAGPAATEAIFSGAVDATYVGPNPAINAWAKSHGQAIKVIAGAASGGASLIVKPSIKSVDDLRGKKIATPQLGNTQDVALRTWLTDQGLKNSVDGGGDVTIAPTANSDVLNLFQSGQLDGAWVPEPYASRLVLEGGGHVLVDEKDLWPDGQFVTTHLIVRTEFLKKYPDTVTALLKGHVAAVKLTTDDATAAKEAVNEGLVAAGGKALDAAVLDRAWSELTVTYDPIASALKKSADNGVAAGTTDKKVDLKGIYDLRPLNAVLKDQSLSTVSAGGLGDE